MELFRGLIEDIESAYALFQFESRRWAKDGHRRSPYRVLVLMKLSQKATDTRLNAACEDLFKICPCPQSFVQIEIGKISKVINPVGLGPTNIKWIEETRPKLAKHKYVVDLSNLDEFANRNLQLKEKMLAYAFGKPALPLDSNIRRLLQRVYGRHMPGLDELRAELKNHIPVVWPQKALIDVHEELRLHSMAVCTARKPKCADCMIGNCTSKRQEFCGFPAYALEEAKQVMRAWGKWRELICNPNYGLSKS